MLAKPIFGHFWIEATFTVASSLEAQMKNQSSLGLLGLRVSRKRRLNAWKRYILRTDIPNFSQNEVAKLSNPTLTF